MKGYPITNEWTVSPTDTDGLIDLIKRIKTHLGVK